MNKGIYGIIDLFNSNRTIVSIGSQEVVLSLQKLFPNSKVERYPSGQHKSSWDIPEQWELLSASLKRIKTNEILFTHKTSPLFIAPYSKSIDQIFTKSELSKITVFDSFNEEEFKYQHRLAYDSNKRLNEVCISIPSKVFNTFEDSENFHLEVEVKTKPGNLEIFNHAIKGGSGSTVYFLSHYCHPGQINDGLAGVVTCARVMERISNEFTNLKYSYNFLAFPETIGSSVFVAEHISEMKDGLFAIFAEMPGAHSDFRVTTSRRNKTYVDRVVEFVLKESNKNFTKVAFRNGWGNDEMVFDSPVVGIPSTSIDRAPFNSYHTSGDNLSEFSFEKLEETVDVIVGVIKILESDYIPSPNYVVPPQLSKLNLYKDWKEDRHFYDYTMSLLDLASSGKSLFDIAISENIPIDFANTFYTSLSEHGLINKNNLSASYTRILF